MDTALSATRHYDLAFGTSSRSYLFRNPNRGVSLTDERISWVLEGAADSAPYNNVASVHLQTGGDWRNAVSHCAITFADRHVLTVTNATATGVSDDDSSRVYRDFVFDLHARLVSSKTERTVRYLAGYQGARYAIMLGCTMILGGIFVILPLLLLIRLGRFEILLTLFAGVGLMWPLVKMISNNMPRDYSPKALPNELLP